MMLYVQYFCSACMSHMAHVEVAELLRVAESHEVVKNEHFGVVFGDDELVEQK